MRCGRDDRPYIVRTCEKKKRGCVFSEYSGGDAGRRSFQCWNMRDQSRGEQVERQICYGVGNFSEGRCVDQVHQFEAQQYQRGGGEGDRIDAEKQQQFDIS